MDLERAMAVLGVSPGYTAGDIKTAYRKLLMKCHPDKAGGSVEKTQEVIDAYNFIISGGESRLTILSWKDIRNALYVEEWNLVFINNDSMTKEEYIELIFGKVVKDMKVNLGKFKNDWFYFGSSKSGFVPGKIENGVIFQSNFVEYYELTVVFSAPPKLVSHAGRLSTSNRVLMKYKDFEVLAAKHGIRFEKTWFKITP